MNKINKLLLTIILLPLMIVNVYASSVPYLWRVGGEEVNVNKPNEAGTAKLEKDGKTVTLYLKDYNGGSLELECYGTGQSDMVFIINLEGENTITSNDTGIAMGESSSKIDFKGTGRLIINAPRPISYEEEAEHKVIDLSQTEEQPEGEKVEETQSTEEITTTGTAEDADFQEKEEDNSNDWLVRGLGILLLISIGVISYLVVKLNMKNKKETN